MLEQLCDNILDSRLFCAFLMDLGHNLHQQKPPTKRTHYSLHSPVLLGHIIPSQQQLDVQNIYCYNAIYFELCFLEVCRLG